MPLLYVLHSSQLYGTERMALATAQGLSDEFETIFIGPPGVALAKARELGFGTREYRTNMDLARVLIPLLKEHASLTFVGTGPRYNLVCMALNLYFRRRIKHIQMLHGGSGVEKDYQRKKVLNWFDITFVVVSEWSKQRLISHGVTNRIEIVGNFLIPSERSAPRREAYAAPGVRKVLIVSRVDQLKRVDLLLDALDARGDELRDMSFRVLGVGPQFDELRLRAAKKHLNVEFAGFSDDVATEMANSDLLLHTCGVETFGLAVLEAMAARLVTLVPDTGGASMLIQDGKCGFTFRGDDAEDLARRLVELKTVPPEVLNRLAACAARRVESDYSAEAALARYRELFSPAAA